MNEKPENCDNCGACCRHMNVPPGYGFFAGASEAHWLKELPEDDEDRLRFYAMPQELQQEIRDYYANNDFMEDEPCIWLENGRCKNYEHRPQICRDFEVGEDACMFQRKMYQLEIGLAD